MNKIYIGIDNGVSGSLAIIKSDEIIFMKTPVKLHINFQKTKKQNINRLDFMKMCKIISKHIAGKPCITIIERPLVNNVRFKASMSAMRCLEATLIVLETYDIPYQYIDSKLWQKEFLPGGIKGSPELKIASCNVGCRLFPQHEKLIVKHKDADSLFIAEYARRHNL